MTENDFTSIKYINITLGIISIVTCFIIIITFLLFKKIRSFVLELITYLSLSCLLQTVFFLIYFPEKDSESSKTICQIQAYGMEFFGISQFLWTCIISFSIYQSVFEIEYIPLSEENLPTTRLIFYTIGFGIPFILSSFGLIFDVYGRAGYWCFIKTEEYATKSDPRYEIFYILTFTLLWICIFFNLILYAKVIYYLRKSFGKEDEYFIRNYTKPLIFYLIIQILCLLPTTINRIYQIIHSSQIDFLDYLQSICDVSQGLLYSLSYGFNPIIRKAYLDVFQKRKISRSLSDFSSNSAISLNKSNLNYTHNSFGEI